MIEISRRSFLAQAGFAAGALAVAGRLAPAAETAQKVTKASDRVVLGRTTVQPTLVGLGTGTNGVMRSSNQQRLGQVQFNALVRHAWQRGLRFFDSADQYGTHIFLREALRGLPRDSYCLLTKTRAMNPEVAKADVSRFREEMGTDVIDILLLHCMTGADWPKKMRPVMDVLVGYKEKGLVRALGVSCHGWESFHAAASCDWIDVQLVRVNPFGTAMDASPDKVMPVLKQMHDAGRGILGMKIFGGGGRTKPEERLKSLRFVLSSGCVDAMTIGAESIEQLDENLAMIEKVLA